MEERSKKVCSSEEVDRLSDLPDPIIHHILSFLDTKYAVHTSLLSKKWRDLWTTVPVLNFDSNSFRLLGPFKKFVAAVLNKLNRNSTVDTFCFSYRGTIGDHHKKWIIDFAISRKVNHLVLDFGWKKQCPAPQALFDCQTLKTIQLRNSVFNKPSVCVALTSLHLERCSFSYGGECCDLLECFHNLSNLRLHACDFGKFKVLKIHGPQLLKLSILSMFTDYGCPPKSRKLEISAPKLTSFSYKYWLPLDFSVMNLPSLQHMDIDISPARISGEEKEMTFQNLFKFFHGICNAQVLTLSCSTIQALATVPGLEGQQMYFNRLKSLKLTSYLGLPFPVPVKVATFLLNGSPNAETILVEWRKKGYLKSVEEASQPAPASHDSELAALQDQQHRQAQAIANIGADLGKLGEKLRTLRGKVDIDKFWEELCRLRAMLFDLQRQQGGSTSNPPPPPSTDHPSDLDPSVQQ